ncbi:hypothetical protein [Sphingobacterium griseoflavum]|uniref:Uncharacterized protein n=1 Tax=Sphingobacterium griseoflavum TaxID=1474952 RepID=A0ABQ3HWW5_9SPHI|nr:hypothetical protein [Sphingobacterium griseoflavum]GHE28984.1 hypothetical protein GCM10017764_09500 [Sphingobacterium griseoflavum]
MKNKIYIFFACFSMLVSATINAHAMPDCKECSIPVSNDSTLYKLVCELAIIVEQKGQETTELSEQIKAGKSHDHSSISDRENSSEMISKMVRDPMPIRKKITGVFINNTAKEVPLKDLVGIDVNELDSLSISLDKSSFGRAVYGNMAEVGVLRLFLSSSSNSKVAQPVSKQPIELKREIGHDGDFRLTIFVKRLRNLLSEAEYAKNSFDYHSDICINGTKYLEINELAKYSLDDVAYVTLNFRSKQSSPKKNEGVICLITYSDAPLAKSTNKEKPN